MKKLCILSLVFVTLLSCNKDNLDIDPGEQGCDNGTFQGIARLKTQAEVEAFAALCYTKINGALVIGPSEGVDSDITDLSSLQKIDEIFALNDTIGSGKLHIINTTQLSSLFGLHNIRNAAGVLIYDNSNLTDLSGLEGITELTNPGGFNDVFVTYNSELTSLEGLHNLTKVGSLNSGISTFINIQGNNSLNNLDAFSSLEAVYGYITIGSFQGVVGSDYGNTSLNNLCGLSNLFENGYFEDVVINENAYDPTVQDIINGNCSQ